MTSSEVTEQLQLTLAGERETYCLPRICSFTPATIIWLSVTVEANRKSLGFSGQHLHSKAQEEGTQKATKEGLGGVRIQMALHIKSILFSIG